MNNEIILTTKKVGEISGKFHVPSYQRGYRWESTEVTRLLDDIYQSGDRDYCLQPVVVRRQGEQYELIDGQQRLTTLYLIYRYLRDINPFFAEPSFSLSYETREKSAGFLRTIDISRRDENIDFWFIANAYEAIQEWFVEDLQIKAMNIYRYLGEHVQIIWYEVGDSEDAISLFTRLNIGKIPLTSAELVKAMFLRRREVSFHAKDATAAWTRSARERQEEIALQWDNMEKELHNDSLWYFLTNDSSSGYQTRIDLILDLMANRPQESRDPYFTYFYFEKMCGMEKEDGKPDSGNAPGPLGLNILWMQIQHTFLTLKDWHENHTLYHKIGYLIASRSISLQEIYVLSRGKTKSAFLAALDEEIRESLSGKESWRDLSYENRQDHERVFRLLLFFNVESVRCNGAGTQWFPFDRFKCASSGEKNAAWSLEHIHAQQSEGLRTQSAWKIWLRKHAESLQAIDSRLYADLIRRMNEAAGRDRLERSEFEQLQQEAIVPLSAPGSTEYLHSISNLALLNTNDNAALSNATFDVKRNEIIAMDRSGQFIPFCTRMVFLKYYTPSEESQLHFWGPADRAAYMDAIDRIISPYLGEDISVESEGV